MKRLMNQVVVIGLSAFTLAIATAQAAPAPTTKVLAQAKATAPWVILFIDTDQGTQLDDSDAADFQSTLSGSTWSIQDNGMMVITLSNGQQWIQIPCPVGSQDLMFLMPHGHSQTMHVDGLLERDPQNPSQGFANLWITFATTLQGKTVSATIVILTDLQFGQQQGGTGGGGGGIHFP